MPTVAVVLFILAGISAIVTLIVCGRAGLGFEVSVILLVAIAPFLGPAIAIAVHHSGQELNRSVAEGKKQAILELDRASLLEQSIYKKYGKYANTYALRSMAGGQKDLPDISVSMSNLSATATLTVTNPAKSSWSQSVLLIRGH